MNAKKLVRTAMDKWTYRLGLRWWNVEAYCYKGKRARKFFKSDDDSTILARTFADWRYSEAVVYFNLPALRDMSVEEIERTVVHELCHVLVNEMRSGDIDHEERVVTGLTKAFQWTEEFSKQV